MLVWGHMMKVVHVWASWQSTDPNKPHECHSGLILSSTVHITAANQLLYAPPAAVWCSTCSCGLSCTCMAASLPVVHALQYFSNHPATSPSHNLAAYTAGYSLQGIPWQVSDQSAPFICMHLFRLIFGFFAGMSATLISSYIPRHSCLKISK
jgi:hypothetical protein